ncbi:hypothetical protein CRI94_08410 [Longibacter salinarum]|uniref:Outer membrane protein beta-barrel domain-containing protein n=1 Tax=Longibacter salinarum TaxID=1850348 RepID=A0A2A8CZM8_9BACT|nr:hypothetical protein [Longibacter salinarum]PEN14053.1 hypothetical protein CRI94_08410 [Longibacter salinarum]
MTQIARTVFAILIAGLLVTIITDARAQTTGIGAGGQIGVSNGGLNPVGLTMKLWISERHAFQGATSFVISDEAAGASYLVLQGDYIFHNFEQVSVGDGLMALYVGPGLQLTFIENQDANIALRAPMGVSYMLGDAPIDIFAEVAPTLQIADASQLRFDGAIGFRYFF